MPAQKIVAKSKSIKKSTAAKKPRVKATVSPSIPSTDIIKDLFGNKIILAFVGLLALVLLLFNIRGWLRGTVIPKTTGMLYAKGVQNDLNNELIKLRDPFAALGYQSLDRTPASCNLSLARSFHTEVFCTAILHGFTLTPTDPTSKATLNARAAKIETLLRENGWSGGNTTLTTLIGNITKGIDYTPDAAYQKSIGKVFCLFDTNTAFSSPHPAAISSNISCSRGIEVLGSPWPKSGIMQNY